MSQLSKKANKAQNKDYQPFFTRLLYALFNGLLYGVAGTLIDFIVLLVRSLLGLGNGQVFWLFAPMLLVLGLTIGFVEGRKSGVDSMDMIQAKEDSHLDDLSIRHDIFRGLGIGIFIFAIIWLILMLMA